MANTFTWNAGAIGDWATGINWVGNFAPSSGDDAVIGSLIGATAYIPAAESEAIAGLVLAVPDGSGELDVVGTLALGGTATIDNGGGLTVGGSVNFGGHGGELVGGTVDLAGGALNVLAPGISFDAGIQVTVPGGTLDGVTLAGTLDTATAISGDIIGGLTFASATVDLEESAPIFVGNQTLAGNTIDNAVLSLASGTLTLAAGVVAGGAYFASTGGGTLVNDGLIDAAAFDDVGGYAGALANNGTIDAGGTSSLSALDNAGRVSMAAGADLAAGVVVNTGLVQIGAAGTFDLTGGNASQDATGTIALAASATLLLGTVDGGTITSDGGTIGGQGTLENVTIDGATAIPGLTASFEGNSGTSVTVAGTLSFAGATAGTRGTLELGSTLTFASDATLANLALTLDGGGGIGANAVHGGVVAGDGALTLSDDTDVTFAPVVAGPSEPGPAIQAATGLTLDGAIEGFAGGLTLRATSGNIVNDGVIRTVSGEGLDILASAGSFAGTGSLSLAAGSAIAIDATIAASTLAHITATGGTIEIGGTLVGDGTPADSTVTIPAGATFITPHAATLKNVTIDANGTVGGIGATLDHVTWRGVALDVEPDGETDVQGGLVVTNAGGGAGTITIAGTNSILAILDSETLDHVTIALGYSSASPGGDSISVLSARGPAITFGSGVSLFFSGNNAFSGFVGNSVINLGTFDVLPDVPSAGIDADTVPFIGAASFLNDGLVSFGQSLATPSAPRSTYDTVIFCRNIQGSFGTDDVPDFFEYLDELGTFYRDGPTSSAPRAIASHPASAAPPGITTASLAADETTIDGTGTIVIASEGGFIDAAIAATQHIVFTSANAAVGFGEPGDVQAAISNFGDFDTIDLALDGYIGGTVTYSGGVLVVPTAAGGISLNLTFASGVSAADVQLADDGVGGTGVSIACFAEGTEIATARGAIAVQHVRVGDRVRTAAGAWRPVVWTGHRTLDCTRHPRPHDVLPIRVAAHAFGHNQPARDMRLSPDHAVFMDGVLIPVRYLLNDMTITQEDRATITYWHVELDAHDVLLAEGLPCESYLDTGNRAAFADGPTTHLHPDFARPALDVWNNAGCAKLIRDGAELEAARSYLLERAAALGHRVAHDAQLHLRAGGITRAPAWRDGDRYGFLLENPGEAPRLMSRAAVPARVADLHPDHRRLGVLVSAVTCDGVAIDLATLSDGWHAPEGAVWRWTDGDAALPPARRIEIRAAALPTGYPATPAAPRSADRARRSTS